MRIIVVICLMCLAVTAKKIPDFVTNQLKYVKDLKSFARIFELESDFADLEKVLVQKTGRNFAFNLFHWRTRSANHDLLCLNWNSQTMSVPLSSLFMCRCIGVPELVLENTSLQTVYPQTLNKSNCEQLTSRGPLETMVTITSVCCRKSVT